VIERQRPDVVAVLGGEVNDRGTRDEPVGNGIDVADVADDRQVRCDGACEACIGVPFAGHEAFAELVGVAHHRRRKAMGVVQLRQGAFWKIVVEEARDLDVHVGVLDVVALERGENQPIDFFG
jgi:hypothetical protein